MTSSWKVFNLIKSLKQSKPTKLFLLILPLFVSINQTAFSATHTASAIQGSFGVSGGAANYTIPITIPPGMAGMEPSVSLSYSSQGGNGLVGLGWNINGLSLISRCAQNLAQDGNIRGVDFTSEDKFCLDGARLININGTAYGADGSEYRTETDSFNKIFLYDADGINGPDYFEVFTKSGQKKIYGNKGGRLDAQIEAEGRTEVHLWPMSRVEDTVGNYAEFFYFNDKANGFTRIDQINYTGNDNGGLTPSASVKFIFEARPDQRFGYMNGSKMNVLERLTNIQTYSGSVTGVQDLVRDYSINYTESLFTNKSIVSTINECDANGLCKVATNLKWNNAQTPVDTTLLTKFAESPFSPAGTLNLSNCKSIITADIDGDGKSDLMCAYDYGG
ncbi:Rhs-family protein, partial [hydrothermal vent metagenome]